MKQLCKAIACVIFFMMTAFASAQNTAPVINGANGMAASGGSISGLCVLEGTLLNVCLDVTDAENDDVDVTNVTLLSSTNAVIGNVGTGDSCFSYHLIFGFNGVDSLMVVACDNGVPSLCDTVVIYIDVIPGAGTGSTVQVCESDTSVNLFDGLTGPYTAGTWLDDDSTLLLTDSIFDVASAAPGTYNFTHFVSGATCVGASATTVTVEVSGLPNAGTGTNLEVCSSDTSINLFDGLSGNPDSVGIWGDIDSTLALNVSIFNPSLVSTGTWNFTYLTLGTGGCAGEADSSSITVEVMDPSDAGIGSFVDVCDTLGPVRLDTMLGGSPEPGGVWFDDDNTGALALNTVNAMTAGEGTWNFTYSINNAGCGAATATIILVVNRCSLEPDITIPEAFSPNGDGANDFFEIPGIADFPENSLVIFNRWGHEVYRKNGYMNEWDGVATSGITIGEGCPEGTYFYVLELGIDYPPIKGNIYLNR